MDFIMVLLVCVVLLAALYWYGTYLNGHYERNGVKCQQTLPFIGNMLPSILGKGDPIQMVKTTYESFPDERYTGMYQFTNHLVVLKDLELIKQITIKDFDHFSDKFGVIEEKIDPTFGTNLLSMKGQKWRDMRGTLSPAFTSAKMKTMFQLVTDCGEAVAEFYLKQMEQTENRSLGYIPVELKDAFTRYTNDVIATSAFAVKVDSHQERENTFYMMAKQATNFSGKNMMKLMLFFVSPALSQLFKIRLFDEKLSSFFRNLVNDGIKLREEGMYRPDMIQLLMEAKRGSLRHEQEGDTKEAGYATVEESVVGKTVVKRQWTESEITGQAILFLIAGFETASTLLCFMAHELAVHPEIQERLQVEIDEVALKNGGKINYTDLQHMPYMDMVVSESLRYWPPVIALDRKCSKAYTMPPPRPGGKEYQMAVGEGLWVPVSAIHHDPKYFPNPEKFDPERFSEENKGSIQPFTYMPFGVGPRNCIGSRFALMEAKSVMFHLLHKFDLTVISKTQIPIKLAKGTFNIVGEKGFWVGLKPRAPKSSQ